MDIKVDVSESGLVLNGTLIRLPCHVNQLLPILGGAYRTTFDKVRDGVFSEEDTRELNEQIRDIACYTWNELGIHCHTDDGVTVNTLSLRMRDSALMRHPDYYATTMFSGTLTINGKPWLKQLEKGDKDEDTTELILGEYSVYAVRADYRLHLFSKAKKYSVIEISLEEDDDDDIDDYDGLFSSVK